MATFVRKNDPMVSCPYNPAHRMLKSRLQMHLVKCKKDNVTIEKKSCPFNAQHLCDPDTYSLHLTICPDRAIIDRQITRKEEEKSEFKGATAVPSYHSSIGSYSEIWELNDRPVAGYNPEKHLSSKNNLVRELAHWKPAERRKYYKDSFHTETDIPSEEINSTPTRLPHKPERICRPPKDDPEVLRNVPILAQLESSETFGFGRGRIVAVPHTRPRIAANFTKPSNSEIRANSAAYGLSQLSVGIGRGGVSTRTKHV